MVLQVPAMMAVIGYFVIVVYAGVRFGRKTHVFKDAFQLSHIQEQQKLFGTDSHLSLLLAICSMTGERASPLGTPLKHAIIHQLSLLWAEGFAATA